MTSEVRLAHSVDRCVQCGFCLPACPTYRLFEREESSPRGRIALAKLLASGEVEADDATLATYDECVGCRACEPACPSGVVYEEVLLYGRELLAKETRALPPQVRLLLWYIRRPWLLTLARLAWRHAGRVVPGLFQRVPIRTQTVALLAALPPPSPASVPEDPAVPDALVHRGCLMDILWEGTNGRAVLLLRDAGISAARISPSAGCCGALHGHAGQVEVARRLARRTIAAWEREGSPTLLSLAGGCGAFMRGYPELFAPDDPWHGRAAALSDAVQDLSSLLLRAGWKGRADGSRVTYQDSCHLRNGLGVWEEPRVLLDSVADFVELPGAGGCCGSAGVYNLLRPDIANRLLDEKSEAILDLGVDEVIVANPGCELQLRLGVRSHGVPARVRHLADFLFAHRGDGTDGEVPIETADV
jgi:glycolate oxidase iron-sulfur subunit